jgi:hypothetical protein
MIRLTSTVPKPYLFDLRQLRFERKQFPGLLQSLIVAKNDGAFGNRVAVWQAGEQGLCPYFSNLRRFGSQRLTRQSNFLE